MTYIAYAFLTFTLFLGLVVVIYNIVLFFRTKVPVISTPKKYLVVLEKNLRELGLDSTKTVYEMGSAWAEFSYMAEKLNAGKVVAFELSPFHHYLGVIRARIKGSKIKFVKKDFFQVDLAEADMVYAFLVKSIINKLWQKMKKECRKGTLLIVLSDELDDVQAYKKIKTEPNKAYSTYYNIYKV